MKNLSMIACVSKDGGLGYQNQLLWVFPEDQRFFRETTMGHPIVMGGNTFASIGRALPGRENIVLSRSEIGAEDVKWFSDKTELDQYLAALDDEKFIIGGASLYRMYVNEAEKIYLTEMEGERPADVFFPEFDKAQFERKILRTGEVDGVKYQMVEYNRRDNK